MISAQLINLRFVLFPKTNNSGCKSPIFPYAPHVLVSVLSGSLSSKCFLSSMVMSVFISYLETFFLISRHIMIWGAVVLVFIFGLVPPQSEKHCKWIQTLALGCVFLFVCYELEHEQDWGMLCFKSRCVHPVGVQCPSRQGKWWLCLHLLVLCLPMVLATQISH